MVSLGAALNVSVIISTYNAPAWLEKVLWGYAHQTHRDFEIIIADDGSSDDTRALIERVAPTLDQSVIHVYQRDDGFRKCRILNKAILHARADYLLFTDGDCIPRADFVASHVAKAAQGAYLSGGYCKLTLPASKAIARDDIARGDCFRIPWLLEHGHRRQRKDLKLSADPALAHWLNRLTTTRCNFKGSNGSAWLRDVVAVNGFDERMAYGSEDREFGVRLRNAGIDARHVRYTAICVHLDHGRSYENPYRYAWNRALRKYNEKHGVRRTEYGLVQLIQAGFQPSVAGLATTSGLLSNA